MNRHKFVRNGVLLRNISIYAVIIVLGSLALLWLDRQNEEQFRGKFHVVDGDTLRLGELRMRLLGFDAPELRQRCGYEDNSWPCGYEAKEALEKFVLKAGFHCRGSKNDRYGRLLVFCYVGEMDIGQEMVGQGMALATQKLLYQKAQDEARDKRIGIWSGPFEKPADWRKMRRSAEMGLPFLALLMIVRRVIGW